MIGSWFELVIKKAVQCESSRVTFVMTRFPCVFLRNKKHHWENFALAVWTVAIM